MDQEDDDFKAFLQRFELRDPRPLPVSASSGLSATWKLFVAAAAFISLVVTLMVVRNFWTTGERKASTRHAGDPMAARQQSATGAGLTFEVASIRLGNTARGPGAAAGPASLLVRCMRPYLQLQVDPSMFAASASVYDLVSLAYAAHCASIEGGPDWASTNRFEIWAVVPKGIPSYNTAQLRNGEAPELQSMIQALLIERFHFSMHREMRQLPVYNLVVAKEGKLKPPEIPNSTEAARPRPRVPTMGSNETTIHRFADSLTSQLDRPVIDRTGSRSLYRMVLEFPELATAAPGQADGSSLTMRDLVPTKLEEQLGLKLVPATASLEILVIDRLERPSEN